MLNSNDYYVKRDWVLDNNNQYGCCIEIFNTVSTDTFAATNPDPQKTFIQLFLHIFVLGLHQFCSLYIFILF